jgi:hypothetical protein
MITTYCGHDFFEYLIFISHLVILKLTMPFREDSARETYQNQQAKEKKNYRTATSGKELLTSGGLRKPYRLEEFPIWREESILGKCPRSTGRHKEGKVFIWGMNCIYSAIQQFIHSGNASTYL